eukprot:327634-Prymnesium_polylepis.1
MTPMRLASLARPRDPGLEGGEFLPPVSPMINLYTTSTFRLESPIGFPRSQLQQPGLLRGTPVASRYRRIAQYAQSAIRSAPTPTQPS